MYNKLSTRLRPVGAALAVGALLFGAAACGSGDSASADSGDSTGDSGAESVTWDFTILVPLAHPSGVKSQEFADAVLERTGGRLEILVRPLGELAMGPPEYVDAVSNGDIEMAEGFDWFSAGTVPEMGVTALTGLVTSNEERTVAVEAAKPHIDGALEGHGITLIGTYAYPMTFAFGRGDVPASFEDFAGLELRSGTDSQARFLESLGARGVTIGAEETPVALQQGVVDGVITTAATLRSLGWHESLNWAYGTPVASGMVYQIVNSEALDALDPEVREALLEVAAEYAPDHEAALDAVSDEAFDELEAGGMTIAPGTPDDVGVLRTNGRDYWSSWSAAQGPSTEETLQAVMDALGVS